ncbi:MAG: adenylate/guanylate cyclase domain-containing protein [Chloroflexi bacterium]|nr:adenylate/guanylate cyclase domain-containing protein [Chloroflexota bacterium]
MLDSLNSSVVPALIAPAAPAPASAPFLTFLFTDIEGSTRLWEEHSEVMGPALAAHDRILRSSVEEAGGSVVKMTGDGMLATFEDPRAAVAAALSGQRALGLAVTSVLRVRMALHAGAAEVRDGDVFGPSINRVARILATGHGGQVLLSASAALLVRDRLPERCELVDLGTHRLRDLDRPEQLFQLVAPDLARDFPPLRSLNNRRTNLPAQLTSFVGRERELAEVATLLARHRLVTLIGTGGTGKTRLMLEAAGRLGDRFPDGTWLAELAPLGDPSQVASEVARALGAPEVPGVPAMAVVTSFLAEKELLLLLDNAEHLVDGVAGVAGRLLAAAPRLRIVTTSREALAVPGEAVLQLQSLSCPGVGGRLGGISTSAPDLAGAAGTEAVQLFMERATAVDPTFTLGAANVAAVSEICRRLDGIPLAIELAAARVSAMSADDIALRLGDRFRLLAGGRRTAVPRQQTLHALIDWSWDLLNDDDRRLLRRLSIFSGGWTAQAAARIVGDVEAVDEIELVDGLTRLVDRSLVIIDRGPTTRYRMLETIRQYAREKLIEAGEVAAVGDRHFEAFAALAADAEPMLRGPQTVDWLDRLDADAENLGAALEWGLEAQPWAAVQMAAAMLAYWAVRVASADNDSRIVAAVEIARARVIAQADADRAMQVTAAWLLGEAARLWGMSGRASVGLAWAKDAVAVARASGDEVALLAALSGLAISTVFSGTDEDLRPMFQQATELAEKSGTWWMLAMSAGFSGATLWDLDHEMSEALLLRADEAARRSGSPYAIGSAALAHGRMLGKAGRLDDAVAAFGVAIDRFGEIGDERFVLAARSDMTHALRRGGRLDEAEALYRETIGGWVRLGHRGAVANQLENIAFLAIARRRPERAARLLGAAEAMRDAVDARMAFDELPEMAANVEQLRTLAEDHGIDAWWAAGRSMSMADAVALAVAE